MTAEKLLNGVDSGELQAFRAAVELDATRADRRPTVVARWQGADAAAVTSLADGVTVSIGGPGNLNAMRMTLAAFAACDVDLIVTRAVLLGVEIESLEVEATGEFNVRRYLGLEGPDGPGYDKVDYAIRLRTRGATPAQIRELRQAVETGSPVGDTLRRQVHMQLTFDAS